jgi:hypothetical protein
VDTLCVAALAVVADTRVALCVLVDATDALCVATLAVVDALCVVALTVVAGRIAAGVTGVGATLVATDDDEVEALEACGVIGWALAVLEAVEALCALDAVLAPVDEDGGATVTVTLGLLLVPAVLSP